MTDEWYRCNSCGVVDGGSSTKYKLNETINDDFTEGMIITDDELQELEQMGIEPDVEEIEVCSECDQESTFSIAHRTED